MGVPIQLVEFNITNMLFTTLLALVLLYLWKIHNSYKFFEKFGLKTPPITFIFGNYYQLNRDRKFSEILSEWTKKYGKTYGYFDGHTPVLVTSDLNMIQEIFIKQYGNFAARKRRPTDISDDNNIRVSIITAIESRWKNMRNIMSPAFSTFKLRELSPTIINCADRFVKNLEKQTDKTINLKHFIKRFTMDNTWNTSFAIDIDLQNSDKENIYIKKTEAIVGTLVYHTFIVKLSIFFHEFRRYIATAYILGYIALFKLSKFFKFLYVDPVIWLRETSVNIVDRRVQENTNKHDILQLLLESYTNNVNEIQNIEKLDAETLKLKKKLSLEEIKMNLAVVITASYDTTSSTLSYCFHTLANMPEEQEKLLAEIEEHFPPNSNKEPDVDNVKDVHYLECFIHEVLRFYPIAHGVVTRRCVHPTTVNGFEIPLGLAVQPDIISLHHDPDVWGPVDTEIFYPSRFQKENKQQQLAFMGFGIGPRNCLGMKFAMLVMKIVLIKTLRKFKIKKTEETKEKLNYAEGFLRIITDDVNVSLERRDK